MSNFIKSYQANVGLNHTPAYQVSGQPYVTASIDASSGAVSADFPYVSRWFQVINAGATPVKVGFSQAGVDGNNYFIVNASGSEGYGISEVYELKVSQVWLSGSSHRRSNFYSCFSHYNRQRTKLVRLCRGGLIDGSVWLGIYKLF
jgi:hypothetical protein